MPKIQLTEQMIADLKTIPLSEMEKKYHITRQTIAKRAKEYGFERFTGDDGMILHKIIDNIEKKWCGGCTTWKPLNEFGMVNMHYDGLSKSCSTCLIRNRKKFELANPTNAAERTAKSYKKHHQKRLDAAKQYRQTDSWQLSNLKQMSKRRNAYVHWNRECQRNMYKLFGRKCAWCDSTENLEMEHFIPIALGGKTEPGNVYPACGKCNRSKYNNDPFEWAKKYNHLDKAKMIENLLEIL